MAINVDGLQHAATLAAQWRIRQRKQDYSRHSILAPLHSLFYCLERSPDDLDLAFAAGKGLLELQYGVDDMQVVWHWYDVVDILRTEVFQGHILDCLRRQKEIESAYIIFYRQALSRAFREASMRKKAERLAREEEEEG